MVDFRFDPVEHKYTLDGEVLPSVSSLLTPIVDFSGVPPDVLAFAADRGTKVHRACELDDDGELDYDALDERLKPYLLAWRQFRRDFNPAFISAEEPMYHKELRYAGTPDRVAVINKRVALPDIKATAEINPTGGVQLTFYAHLVESFHQYPVDDLMIIQLRKDATYKMQQFKRDEVMFRSLLAIYNWKQRNPK